MKKKPLWAYDLEDTLTEEGANKMARALVRVWNGEKWPLEWSEKDKAEAENAVKHFVENAADHRSL